MSEHQYFVVDQTKVVSETLDGETIIINLHTGAYYSLNPSASVVWECVAGTACSEDVVAVLCARYEGDPAEIGYAVKECMALLSEEGLIVPAENSTQTEASQSLASKEPFVAPDIEKYTDMQEMLLADPIHDVDATGWPSLKESAS